MREHRTGDLHACPRVPAGVRPPFAIEPGPGQVSVWDFPRPPRIERFEARVRIDFAGQVIADSTRTVRLCETASPPTYYIPVADIAAGVLVAAPGSSFCEWKGLAMYWHVQVGSRRAERAAWSYASPMAPFGPIAGMVAFYAAPFEACWVGDARVTPQPGVFYGGWITPDVVGPFKGEPGTGNW